MSKLHFTGENPKVAVTYWSGSNCPKYIKNCLFNNSKYFDRFILITDVPEEFSEFGSVEVIKMTQTEMVEFLDLNSVKDKLNHPAKFSDLVCHFAKKLVNHLTSSVYDRVMYFDANTVIYNKFLVNYYFNRHLTSITGITYKGSPSFYPDHKPVYYSADFSVDTKDMEQDEMIREVILKYISNSYVSIGPVMVNLNNNDYVFKSNMVGQEIDPRWNYNEMMNRVNFKLDSIGLWISATMFHLLGKEIDELHIDDSGIYFSLKDHER